MNFEHTTRGQCYENSFRTLLDHPHMTLVHGIAIGKGRIEGVPHGHAWLEHNGCVYGPTYGVDGMPAAIYYGLGRIEYTVRYTHDEACVNAALLKIYGAWDAKIAATTHRRGRKRA